MTYEIANDLPPHPYSRMSYPIIPGLECIDILENHFICNMWNEFYVYIVQSRLQGIHSRKSWPSPLDLVIRRNSSLFSS
jgi:hypothetical protein